MIIDTSDLEQPHVIAYAISELLVEIENSVCALMAYKKIYSSHPHLFDNSFNWFSMCGFNSLMMHGMYRLFDPISSHNNKEEKNCCFELLKDSIVNNNVYFTEEEKDVATKEIDTIKNDFFCMNPKSIRNKLLSHNDLKSIYDNSIDQASLEENIILIKRCHGIVSNVMEKCCGVAIPIFDFDEREKEFEQSIMT